MSARTQLVTALREALPTYRVTGSAVMPAGISRPTVAVWQQSIERRDGELGPDLVTVVLQLWVLVGSEDPEKADDALDDAVIDVLGALQPLGWVQWSDAQRGVLGEALHGYNITVTAVATITEGD